MGRAAKDCACSVVHQDEVGDINGQVVIGVEWVAYSYTSVEAHLLCGFDFGGGCATFAAFSAEGCDLWIVLFQLLGQRMIGRDPNKGCAHQCVGACCIDFDAVMAFRRIGSGERKLQTARFADPVFLHQTDLGRPVFQIVQC